MTDDELRQRWVDAIVKRDTSDEVGQVISVTPMGGRLVLEVMWGGGVGSTVNASAVSILTAADVEVAFRQWRLRGEECTRLRKAVESSREILREAVRR